MDDELMHLIGELLGDAEKVSEMIDKIKHTETFGRLVESASLLMVMDAITDMVMTVALVESVCDADHSSDEDWKRMVETLIPAHPTVADLSGWLLLRRTWNLVAPIIDKKLRVEEEVA